MTQIWRVSDTHFGQEKIIGYAGRPFDNAAVMDEAMIERWNTVVKPQDHIYHLGDVSMSVYALRKLVGRLQGHKRLLRGNHDIFKTKEYLKAGFEEIAAYRVIADVILSHIPIHPISLKQRWLGNIHGHTHEKVSKDLFGTRYLNISVEQTDYAPLALEDAVERLKAQLSPEDLAAYRNRKADTEDFSSTTTEASYEKVLVEEGDAG